MAPSTSSLPSARPARIHGLYRPKLVLLSLFLVLDFFGILQSQGGDHAFAYSLSTSAFQFLPRLGTTSIAQHFCGRGNIVDPSQGFTCAGESGLSSWNVLITASPSSCRVSLNKEATGPSVSALGLRSDHFVDSDRTPPHFPQNAAAHHDRCDVFLPVLEPHGSRSSLQLRRCINSSCRVARLPGSLACKNGHSCGHV